MFVLETSGRGCPWAQLQTFLEAELPKFDIISLRTNAADFGDDSERDRHFFVGVLSAAVVHPLSEWPAVLDALKDPSAEPI